MEIIGAVPGEANIEILKMTIKILDDLGIRDYNIDISITDVFDAYRKKKDGDIILNAVKNRNYGHFQYF